MYSNRQSPFFDDQQQQQQQHHSRPTSRTEMLSAIHRQEELRQRIKAVQALSQSSAITTAFSPSIPSKRGQRAKSEFHSRGRNPEGPAPVQLSDLTQGVGVRHELSVNRAAAQRRANPSYWMAHGTAKQQEEESVKLAKHESPTATHILSASRKVDSFTRNLNESKRRLNAQVKVPSSAVVEDDARAATQTHKQRQRAQFLRGVLATGGSGSSPRGGRPASASMSLPDMPSVAGRADEESDARSPSPTRMVASEFQPLLERESLRVNTVIQQQQRTSPPRTTEMDNMLGARRLRVRPASVPPTAWTAKTCSSMTSYKQLIAAASKLNQKFDLDSRLQMNTDDIDAASAALRSDLAHVARRRNGLIKKAPPLPSTEASPVSSPLQANKMSMRK